MQPSTTNHLRPMIAFAIAALLCFITAAAHAETSAPTAYPAQTIPADRGCATCGMYPAHYPQWQQQLIFKDKSMAAFDGGKCLFRFLLNMATYDARHTLADVAMIWVKDFNTGAWTDGTKAFYVVGSNVMGPMGKEIIPFTTQEAAQKFQQQNGGAVEPYANITMDTLKPLMGGMMHMQHGGH